MSHVADADRTGQDVDESFGPPTMLLSLIDPTGPSNRMGYLGRLCVALVLTFLPASILAGQPPGDAFGVMVANTLQTLAGVVVTVACARRLRHLGASPWLSLVPPALSCAAVVVAAMTGLLGLIGMASFVGVAFIIALLSFPGHPGVGAVRAT